ncbi:hypothetical protein M8J77_002665 [Diaphorina citri]|nr:hypothetical protein M8J77_002665 [Diaphorina citri]
MEERLTSHVHLTVSDYVEIPGFLILKSFAGKHVLKKSQVHMLSYESSKRDLNLPPEVQVHPCGQNPLGWINGNNQEKPSLLKDLENIGKQQEEIVVIVDSLLHLLHNTDLCRNINKIINQQGPVKVKQLICLLHEDSLTTEVKSAARSLLSMFRTHVDMVENDKISIVHKKNSGKILSEVNKIWWDKQTNCLESSQVTATDFQLKPPAPSEEPVSTFNLGLSDSEKMARDRLILPYVNSGRPNETTGGGMIYIEPEDYDEEDPDDDLDV